MFNRYLLRNLWNIYSYIVLYVVFLMNISFFSRDILNFSFTHGNYNSFRNTCIF